MTAMSNVTRAAFVRQHCPEAFPHVRVMSTPDPTTLRLEVPAAALPRLAEWRQRLLTAAQRQGLPIARVEIVTGRTDRMIIGSGAVR